MEETKRCLKELNVFSKLDWKEVQLICEKAQEKKYKSGEIIFFEKGKNEDLYILLEGRVKLSMLSPEGREMVITILRKGDIFGEISLFDEDSHPVSAEVDSDARLVMLSNKDLEFIIMQKPGVAVKIIQALARKTRLLTSQVRELVFSDAEGRLAALLYRFMEDFGVEVKSGYMIDLLLTHQEIANLMGTSRVTVTKTINKFIDKGIVKIYKRKIVIIDQGQLSRILSMEKV